MIYKYFSAVLTVFFLSGCGGGGEDLSANMDGSADGSSGGTATNQSAEGLWRGEINLSNIQTPLNALAIGVSDKKFFMLSGSGSDYQNLWYGNLTISGNSISSNDLKRLDMQSSMGSFNGTVSSKILNISSISIGALSGDGSLNKDDAYKNTSSIDAIKGKYLYTPDSNDIYRFEVITKSDTEAQILGTSLRRNCTFSGILKTINYNNNLYQLSNLKVNSSFTVLSACDALGGSTDITVDGYATVVKLQYSNKPAFLFFGLTSDKLKWFSGFGESI
jgi:hypothetical protein